ncbi:MAG: hypothetical protein AB1921_14755 [Thermodesulfobacteriota bacterium]
MPQGSRIMFPGQGVGLEGVYTEKPGDRAAVLCHPHPLYGGDMDNPVVLAMEAACLDCGISTLRFNFRGTGRSEGFHADGPGEAEDLLAAAAHCEKVLKKPSVLVCGYSFGAYAMALAGSGLGDTPMIMVAPAVAFLSFPREHRLSGLGLAVAGARDAYAPPDLVRRYLEMVAPEAGLHVIENADHFFWGHLDEVRMIIAAHLRPSDKKSLH